MKTIYETERTQEEKQNLAIKEIKFQRRRNELKSWVELPSWVYKNLQKVFLVLILLVSLSIFPSCEKEEISPIKQETPIIKNMVEIKFTGGSSNYINYYDENGEYVYIIGDQVKDYIFKADWDKAIDIDAKQYIIMYGQGGLPDQYIFQERDWKLYKDGILIDYLNNSTTYEWHK